MKQYNDIVKNVLENGIKKTNRTGINTYSTFCEIFRHDMRSGFPLLTTKKMPYRTIAVELEGFISGITSKSWYKEKGCNIWNEWANPKSIEHIVAGSNFDEESIKLIQKTEDDLGPIYGYQWRSWNKNYGCEECGGKDNSDQLKKVIDTLKTNPNDRRMVVSAWNPEQMDMMALPPCHYSFTIVHLNGVLNLCWKQRSADLMLGVPFNIASYGLLLELIAKEVNMVAGELVGVLEDCHIYENHIEGAKEQLSRNPKKLPTISIHEPYDIYSWTHKDFDILGYECHEKINFGQVAV